MGILFFPCLLPQLAPPCSDAEALAQASKALAAPMSRGSLKFRRAKHCLLLIGRKPIANILYNRRAFVYKTCPNLYQRCAGSEFFPGIFRRKNTTRCNNRYLSVGFLMNVLYYFSRTLTHGSAA